LQSKLTFADISGPEAVVSLRLHEGAGAWLPISPSTLDVMAAIPLTFGGERAVVCHAGCTTPGVQDLLASAGHSLSRAVTYRSARELQAILADLAHRRRKIIVSHIPADNLLHPESYLVPPALQIELNHKANLPRYTPSQHVLPRRCIPVPAVSDATKCPREPPVVLKPATVLPTGGGFAVVICRNHRDLEQGLAMFRQASSTAEGVIVEEFRDFERSWCAQVAIDDSRVVYLGAAAQVCSAEGRYLGNLCGIQHEAPAGVEHLALAIGNAGQAAGYRGFAGFDIGVDPHGQLWAFDLNFRVCGSLAQLLFHESLCRDRQHAVTRNVQFESPLEVSDLAHRLRPFIDDGAFVPIAALDGPPVGDSTSIVVGYAVASSTDAVEELRSRMRSEIEHLSS
jgi:hypothetical protein